MKVAIASVVIVLALVGAIAGSWALALNVSHQSNERLCAAFAYFIHPPVPPINTPAKIMQEQQYQRLLIFESKLGC